MHDRAPAFQPMHTSVCHVCQLLSVFDLLPADIFSHGKNSKPHTGIRVGIHPHSSYSKSMSYVLSHFAGTRSHSHVHNSPRQQLLPLARHRLLICLCYAMCLKCCAFCFLDIPSCPCPLILQDLGRFRYFQRTHALYCYNLETWIKCEKN